MASRKTTNAHTSDWSLTPQQQAAVDILASGRTMQETADQVQVARETVSGWVNHHPGFQAMLNQRRQELWADMVDRLRGLLPKALDVVARELEGEGALAAAIHVLRCCGVYGGLAAPSGPTDPAIIAAQQQLAEDERQHAAEEVERTISRRARDRTLAALMDTSFAGFGNGGQA